MVVPGKASAAPGAGADRRDNHGHGGNSMLLGCADERQRVRRRWEEHCAMDTMLVAHNFRRRTASPVFIWPLKYAKTSWLCVGMRAASLRSSPSRRTSFGKRSQTRSDNTVCHWRLAPVADLVVRHYVASAFDYCGHCGLHPGVAIFVLGCSLHVRPRLCKAHPTVLQAARFGDMQSQMAARFRVVGWQEAQNRVHTGSVRLF